MPLRSASFAARRDGLPTRLLPLWVLLFGLGACGGGEGSAPPEPAAATEAEADAGAAARGEERRASGGLGEGFVVWESNRTGAWRIWTRRLDGSGLRQLTADEPGRQHCCPHISPDGALVAYLSVAGTFRDYPDEGLGGPLHVVGRDGSGDRIVAPAARNHFENRAVVWLGPRELIYISPGGGPVRLDLSSGDSEPLLRRVPDDRPWLINAALTHATSGQVSFSVYDRVRRAVSPRSLLGGCQPYFSGDGRWGFWTAGAGGPLNRLELASRQISTVLEKNDPRVPDGLGYAYFPMFSRDGRLFSFAASTGDHDHFRADYEILVAESDPRTLELIGPAVRLTEHPATDRYPDVFLEPLPLGRHAGEAPLSIDLEAPDAAADWEWSFGDGSTARGRRGAHRYERPGRFAVEAQRGGERLRGAVVVAPPRPPRPADVSLVENGAAVIVRFDEEVALEEASAAFESGRAISRLLPGTDGRSLRIEPAERLAGPDRLRLQGVRDRAQQPNVMAPATLEIEPPLWPSRREGLVFLWEAGDAPNLVPDPASGVDRAWTLAATGLARLDHDWAMRLDGGAFYVEAEQAHPIRAAAQGSNELSLELTLTPAGEPAGKGTVVALSAGRRGQAFALYQQGDRLLFSLRIGNKGPEANPVVELGRVESGRATHLVVTYTPGRLAAYLDGRKVVDSDALQGDFFHWRTHPLVFGAGGVGGDWAGAVEGVAIYDRVLPPSEVEENALRYRTKRERRPEVPRLVVEGRLTAASRPPTLQEISPYREALAVAEYEVLAIPEGAYGKRTIRVARWVLLDGEPVPGDAPGETVRLVLEPFADNPQLESVFLADTLKPAAGPLYYDVGR